MIRKVFLKLTFWAVITAVAGIFYVESALAQLRVPPSYVGALATLPNDDAVARLETDTIATQSTVPVTPIQHVMPTPAVQAQPVPPQAAPTPEAAAMIPVGLQVQPQLQMALPPQTMIPGMTAGAIVVPVTVPQYMTYTPQPVTMMVNRPAQLVIPQYPMPQPMYDPITMQMMQQQMMMPQQMPAQQMMMPPQPPSQQPIPIKMILPDGSTVSIKHYVPGNFFRNVWRAVTP